MNSWRSSLAAILCCCIANLADAAPPQQPAAPKYKLTVVENAATAKRVKKGRVSSQAVVKVTDENDVPVPGVVVTFTLPQFTGGASFAHGGLTSLATTNASGQASSGAFTAPAGTSFSVGVSTSVSGAVLTTAVPITATSVAVAAAGAGGAGISAIAIVGIVAAVGVAGAVAAVKILGGKSSGPQGTIGAPTGITIGQ